jgi:hypothetical protein
LQPLHASVGCAAVPVAGVLAAPASLEASEF